MRREETKREKAKREEAKREEAGRIDRRMQTPGESRAELFGSSKAQAPERLRGPDPKCDEDSERARD